ncbi:sensor histidine kinase [Fibrella forsythiae]|uniref:histidine kinase n=1 Tax=Fibrella forsythiae TaxID=2817061 RepID=A0ABS3JLZ5_9BACT|nr:HAMP domain-containing sensor histidine kinase [Fibrella forsythiae]MBO0951023.1 HAMP domain-containing histidine kinase [Fibrella forsythiae]
MAAKKKDYQDQIDQLVDHLHLRRESILNHWRTLCGDDQTLSTRTSFSREEFYDQVPALLNILAQRLQRKKVESDPVEQAGLHGLHRWQRGYLLNELLTELDLLYKVLIEEFQVYVELHPDFGADAVAEVYGQLYQISRDTNIGSVMYYDELRQTSAAEQVGNLQRALDSINQLIEHRSEYLQTVSHDLRSNFGVLLGVTDLLTFPTTKKEQANLINMLNRNLLSIRDMLFQLTDFARIEANHEQVNTQKFDVSTLLRDTVLNAQSVAEKHNLELRADGPSLVIKSDRLKILRILQNLLFNALKYTKSGSIYVSWAQENDTRWIMSVQDSGPGLTSGPAALLANQLRPLAQLTSTHQSEGPTAYPSQQAPDTLSERPSENLGLFIVKKFCDLLKASMDIETAPGQGTLIRIRLLIDQSQ